MTRPARLLSAPWLALFAVSCIPQCSDEGGIPTAHADQALAVAGRPTVIDVLSNDTDPDGDTLSVAGVSVPQHGTAGVNADGTVTYTGEPGYRGDDAFTYTASDGHGNAATGTVSLTVHLIGNTVVYQASSWSPLTVAAVADGAGGAIVVWLEARSAGIQVRAQRTDASLSPQWAADGVLVSTIYGSTAGGFSVPVMKAVSDAAGGVIAVWTDHLKGATPEVWAQRLDHGGAPVWTANGVPVGSGAAAWPVEADEDLSLLADGGGGVFVGWTGGVAGPTITGARILGQRLDGAGTRHWGTAGAELSTVGPDQVDPMLVPDGAGGFVLGWWQFGGQGNAVGIRAQRVSADAGLAWDTAGVSVPGAGYNPVMISDGAGGALLFSGANTVPGAPGNVLGQRVDGSGGSLWGGSGTLICGADGEQEYPLAAPDGAGGAIVTWWDHRGHAYDTARAPAAYAQRVDAEGAPQWIADGVRVSGISAPRTSGRSILPDGLGGAIVVWQDDRDGADDVDVFAHRLTSAGTAAWAPDGLQLTDTPRMQGLAAAVPDGGGGALVFFADQSAQEPVVQISGQRVTVDGTLP